jgi:hypothetical protein
MLKIIGKKGEKIPIFVMEKYLGTREGSRNKGGRTSTCSWGSKEKAGEPTKKSFDKPICVRYKRFANS